MHFIDLCVYSNVCPNICIIEVINKPQLIIMNKENTKEAMARSGTKDSWLSPPITTSALPLSYNYPSNAPIMFFLFNILTTWLYIASLSSSTVHNGCQITLPLHTLSSQIVIRTKTVVFVSNPRHPSLLFLHLVWLGNIDNVRYITLATKQDSHYSTKNCHII